jgi:filamentous hemagglutinin family protein
MMRVGLYLGLVSLGTLSILEQVHAQSVVPDSSLGTIVTGSPNFAITGGTRPNNGPNLFHSFSQFSIPTGGTAAFNNAPDIVNIFGRVTGGTASNIDGILQANGTANLFLLNPAGILFGTNARLNIGGSFVGTTANSIQFADGSQFIATNSTPAPLLTMSVPIGLQMGQNSSRIQVQGQGHQLKHPPIFAEAATRDPMQVGLKVQPGRTLALIGNGIQLDRGVLIAESGQVKLGSLSAGTVHLNSTLPQWNFSTDNTATFSNIHLTQSALIDASGNPGGSIHLQGKDIQLQNSSILFVQHYGTQAAGRIQVKADLLELSGALPNKDQSLILSENLGTSPGAHIDISARQIVARDGGEILSTTFRNRGMGGDVSVNARESIQLFGVSPFDGTRFSGIGAPSNFGGGRGGNISITTGDFIARNGAGVISRVLGGQGTGTIQIRSNTISLIGENPVIAGNSSIISSTFLGGDAGSIVIDTGRIVLGASGAISASTSGSGNAGSLTINARESIEIDGSNVSLALPSRISASGQQLALRFRQIFGLPALPTGNGGNLVVNSPKITVRNQGFIAAENVGSGNAGYLKVQANSILLEQHGQIRTSTTSGQGGNLELTARESLIMRQNSLISARAGERGNGGNVLINAPIIAGFENSDIIANAVRGRGGNTQITTQGIVGLQFRPQRTSESDMTASSEFGVNGSVQVDNVGVDPNSGLVELSETLLDTNQGVAAGCSSTQNSSFIITGRGGTPENPTEQVLRDRPWVDLRPPTRSKLTLTQTSPLPSEPLIEATSWYRNPQTGKVELIAAQPSRSTQPVTCS